MMDVAWPVLTHFQGANTSLQQLFRFLNSQLIMAGLNIFELGLCRAMLNQTLERRLSAAGFSVWQVLRFSMGQPQGTVPPSGWHSPHGQCNTANLCIARPRSISKTFRNRISCCVVGLPPWQLRTACLGPLFHKQHMRHKCPISRNLFLGASLTLAAKNEALFPD